MALGPHQSDEDWAQWVSEIKPVSRYLAVPGFHTAQRFKGINISPPPYLALYSVDSLAVFDSPEYKGMRGGNLTTSWTEHITYWHRNLFDGLDRAPLVPEGSVLLVLDRHAPDPEWEVPSPFWLRSVGLDRSTPYRGLAVLTASAAGRWVEAPDPTVKVYMPI